MEIDLLVTTNAGTLSLNTGSYRLGGDSFAQESTSHRRTEVVNPHVEGSFVVNSLRENVTTAVSVWVEAPTRGELIPLVRTLCSAFDQTQFSATLMIDGYSQVWNCYASDYTVTTQRELMHASKARLDVQLVRDPAELEM